MVNVSWMLEREERERGGEGERQTERETERKDTGRRERVWFLFPQTSQKQNKNNIKSFALMMREPSPPSKLGLRFLQS